MATYTTNVPLPTFGATGWQSPTEAQIFAGVVADLVAVFGAGLNTANLSSPQMQLASSLTALIGNVYDTFLYYTNQVDPSYAIGRMQDAIGRIYFINRNPATPTILNINCVGLQGVPIPYGALIEDGAQNTYYCTTPVSIPSSGNITTTFACSTPGPVPVPSTNTVSIYQSIPGWDAVTCLGGVAGAAVETPQAFEARRSQSVAQNSLGTLPAILGAVLSVPGVLDAYVTENTANTVQVIGGVTLVPNSLYVAVVGGAAQAVATAIWQRKPPGCSYNGNTTVTVQDTSVGYSPPYPTYSVVYETPTDLQIFFYVIIANSASVPSNVFTLVRNAIVGAFAGLDGGPAATIAGSVFASRYYSTIAALGPWAQIVSIEMGSINAPAAVFTASVAGTTMTVTAITSGTIYTGAFITDITGNLPSGVNISSQISGTTGSTGTYQLDTACTVASETMYCVATSAFKISTNINQIPSITAANISVSLQ